MKYQVTTNDKRIVQQRLIEFRVKIDVLDMNNVYVDTIEGAIVSGSSTVDAESDIRRTFNLTVLPTVQSDLKISSDGIIWLNKKIRLSIGIKDQRSGEYTYWNQGVYVFMNTSASYDATTNQISIDCSDQMAMLDGTKNGQVGALTTKIPAYEEDETTGEVIHYYVIRDALRQTITQIGHFENTEIGDIGEYYAMPEYNDDWETYREESKVPVKDGTLEAIWNTVPYDLEFSAGCSVLSIMQELVNLYPNYEQYFDIEGTYCCNMIPSTYEDDIILDSEFFKKMYISENTTLDMSAVRNVVIVYGEAYEADFYNEASQSLSGSTYIVSLTDYEEYYNGDIVAFKVGATNPANALVNINSYGAIALYDENTEQPLAANTLVAGSIYTFRIKKKYVSGQTITRIYLKGMWQAEGLAALVSNSTGDTTHMYETESGTLVPYWSKEYFKDVYNCNNVELVIIPDSPFTIQALQQEILDVKEGSDYEKISSDALALARAKYELWKDARLTDSISIETKIIPWLDVNWKVSYQPALSDTEYQYIIKSISHDWSSGQSSISMIRFYPLYQDD